MGSNEANSLVVYNGNKMRLVVLLLVCVWSVSSEDDGSYSYHSFRGPVSGEIQRIVMPSVYRNQEQTVDYVAKPDYVYSYGVQDPVTGNSQNHQESRDGDAVTGEYRVLQADGIVRVVRYTAGGNTGFQATVTYEKP